MKSSFGFAIILFAAVVAFASAATAQAGSIEFAARAAPSGGLEEPVRGFPFYLLTKSFEGISQEAEAATPEPNMDAFIDKLDASPELKAWMKKNHWIALSGDDFIHKLKVPDVMGVPEFYKAYRDRNVGNLAGGFPTPKFKASDMTKDPAKYDRLSAEYKEAIRKYMEQNPDSIDGIDLNLAETDSALRWSALQAKRNSEVHRQELSLAQSKYLVGRAETNLQGQGSLRGVPPGTYWLSTLDVAADVGDARPLWDVPVTVRAGQTEYLTLSNVNAVQPTHSSP